jgi:acyl carrier protein
MTTQVAIEERLLSMWTQALPEKEVGVHDDFFKLGGYSMLAAQLVSEIREAFQIELTFETFFEASTIARLASYIIEHGGQQPLDTITRQATSEKSLDEMLLEIDSLSEEEVAAMLEQMEANMEGK